MRDLVLTGHAGDEHGRMAELTAPLMERYAEKHGADFAQVDLTNSSTPASWMKVNAVGEELDKYDRVLWLDCDVVIARSSENIFDSLPEGGNAVQGLVEHHTECGHVPNCGVWLVAKEILSTLQFLWDRRSVHLHHPWWEQAAVLELMGYSLQVRHGSPYADVARSSPLRDQTVFLPPKWNHHPADVNKPDHPNFVHVTQYADRIAAIRRFCDTAT